MDWMWTWVMRVRDLVFRRRWNREGTYGVIAYMAGKRTSEFGVRLALGANPGQVSRLVLGEAIRLGAAGIGVGILATVALTQVMEGLLYGVSARDPLTLFGASAILGVTG